MTSIGAESGAGTGPGPDAREVPRRAWRALAIGAFGYVIFGFNSTATNLAFGSIAESFDDVPESVVSWVASGYFIAAAAFLPLAGRLADRLGRRRVFNAGLIGIAVFALVSGLAPDVWTLIAGRVGQAVSAAMVIPSSLSMALPDFPEHRRPSAVATWAAAGPLSGAIAPSAAAALLQVSSWRWVYLVSFPAALVILAFSLRFVSPSRADEVEGRLDLLGTVLATASIALLILGISQGPSWGYGSVEVLASVAGAVLAFALFLVRSLRHPTPLLNLSLFRVPQVAWANLANLLMSTTSLSIWLVWPLYLGRVWGYSTAQIGLAITAGPLCAGPASLLGGRLADRFGQRWLMIGGSALATAAVLLSWARFGTEPDYLRVFLPTVAGFGLGWGLSNPSMNSWALSEVAADVYGEVNASFNTIRNLAAAIGVSVAVAIIGDENRPDALAAYDRANLFFAASIGLSCVAVAVGTFTIARRGGSPTGTRR